VTDDRVRYGFYVAGAFNIVGILFFTRLFTNRVLFETDPALFSSAGCAVIVLWGLAYIAQSASWRQAPWVSAAFAIEKLFFAAWWGAWLASDGHRLAEIRAADMLAGAFYGLYGAGDALFMVFFAWAALRARRIAA
jgi:hypothetical protein